MHTKVNIITNFKKSQSLMNKIVEMIEQDKYCIDIMQQNLAAIGLLRSAHIKLFENHLNSCFKTAIESSSKAKKQKMLDEILEVYKLNSR